MKLLTAEKLLELKISMQTQAQSELGFQTQNDDENH